MNESDKFRAPPRLTATPRQVECVTQLFWESANAASPDLFQQVRSHLLAFFRAQGCAPRRGKTGTEVYGGAYCTSARGSPATRLGCIVDFGRDSCRRFEVGPGEAHC